MIVKNEEKFLEACLNSVTELVDEIIIVDTGSTDATKEIAQRFTDNVFDFVWCDDFSAARNESLKHATGEWVLVLDADETIAAEDVAKMRRLIEDATENVGGFVLTQRNYVQNVDDLKLGSFGDVRVKGTGQDGFVAATEDVYGESNNVAGWLPTPIVRLFRRESALFTGVVHEDVSESLGREVVTADVPIHHYGKLNVETWKRKGDLYGVLAEKKVEEKKDYHAYFELARQYVAEKKFVEAQEMLEKSIALNRQFWVSWSMLGGVYLLQEKMDEAIVAFENARRLNPNVVDVYNNLGVAYSKQGNFGKAIEIFTLGLNLDAKRADIFKNMALCYQQMGDVQRAQLAFRKAVELNPAYGK